MRTLLHLKPGKKGTKQLLAQYGDRLVCALSLRCAAEEALQDHRVDSRGTRVGTASAAFCRGRDGGSTRRLRQSGAAGTGEAGGWAVESQPQGVGAALRTRGNAQVG